MDTYPTQVGFDTIKHLLQDIFSIPSGTQVPITVSSSDQQPNRNTLHFSVRWPVGSPHPTHLVLITGEDAVHEASFYRNAARAGFPISPCLGCDPHPATDLGWIVFEDLASTHTSLCDWPTPPPYQAGCQIVETLASLQAAFWQPVRSEGFSPSAPQFLMDENAYSAYLADVGQDFDAYSKRSRPPAAGDWTLPIAEILSILPGLWKSFWVPRCARGGLPLVHGDLTPEKILYAAHAPNRVVLTGWDSFHLGLPPSDLASLLGLHLCPEYDDALPFLRCYHQRLSNLGVSRYSFDDLLADYEIALLYECVALIKRFAREDLHEEILLQNALTALDSIRAAGY